MSVQLAKLGCPTCPPLATVCPPLATVPRTPVQLLPRAVSHSAPVQISEVALTNAWSAVQELELCLADYRESLAIYTDRPTINSRALVAMAAVQLRMSVSEVPEV